MNAASNSDINKVWGGQTETSNDCLGQPGNVSLMRCLPHMDTKEGQITVPEQPRTLRWHNFDGIHIYNIM